MTIYEELVNYYLNNPPFELSDEIKDQYSKLLAEVARITLIEYSENRPNIKEKIINSDKNIIDIYEIIDKNLMDFILFDKLDKIPGIIAALYNIYIDVNTVVSHGLIDNVAVFDKLYLIHDWFSIKKSKIMYNNKNIKIEPNTDYYVLYYAYKNPEDLTQRDVILFKKLLEINLLLSVYQSSIFSSEGGIRSVALSGLQVSFNVPSTETYVRSLQQEKDNILALFNDYDIETF